MSPRTSIPRPAILIAAVFALLGLMAVYYAVRIHPAETIEKQFTGLGAPAHRGQPTSLRPGRP